MLSPSDNLSVGSATGNPRNKVALKKGRGLMDWVRLGNSESDLAGTKGKIIKVTSDVLAKHNKRKDAWIALRGNVYNVTPYFEFHPGGEDELMRGAGIDATALFNEVHKWVNFESMLKKCFVGPLVESKSLFPKPSTSFLSRLPFTKTLSAPKKDSFLTPSSGSSDTSSLSLPSISTVTRTTPVSTLNSEPKLLKEIPLKALVDPKYDWFQTKEIVDVVIYTKCKDVSQSSGIVVINEPQKFLKVFVYIQDHVYIFCMKLSHLVEENVRLKVSNGKIDILLNKLEKELRWASLGKELAGHDQLMPLKDREIEYLTMEIVELSDVTHNTFLMKLEVPGHVYFSVPIGYHVYLKHKDSDVVKPYTPVLSSFEVVLDNEDEIADKSKNLEIFFKVYSDGVLTPLLSKLSIGDELEVSLPEGTFLPYHLQRATRTASHLILLAAGTGITPHMKLILEAIRNKVKTILLMFNQTEDDIPWHSQWDELSGRYQDLKVYQVLSRASSAWSGLQGRVRRELLEDLLPTLDDSEYSSSAFVCVCGTTGFTEISVSILEEMGYSKENIWTFTG